MSVTVTQTQTLALTVTVTLTLTLSVTLTCVESDADTVAAAQQFFIPLMFAPDDCTSAAARRFGLGLG